MSRHSPEAEEILDLLVGRLRANVLDVNGGGHVGGCNSGCLQVVVGMRG
jgi:hypothetical protein